MNRNEDTVDFDPEDEVGVPSPPTPAVRLDVKIGAATHSGKVRSGNEDHFVVVRRTRNSDILACSLDPVDHPTCHAQQAWLLAVADGLGGEVGGEVASAAAIRAILDFGCRLSSWVMQTTDEIAENLHRRIELYAQAIQQELQARADDDPTLRGMGTTVTAAYLFDSSVLVSNVGDSRSYLIRDGQIEQITRDHTMARDLVESGAEPDSVSRFQNVLTRCFSASGESVQFDLFRFTLISGDCLLLCSDGLTDMVEDQEIQRIIVATTGAQKTCDALVERALENGGRDNVTVVLVRV